MYDKPILVFIEGPVPTEADKELFEKIGATQFVNVSLHSYVIAHRMAAAVDPKIIPEGYRTELEVVDASAPAPVQNPSAPAQSLPSGGLGIQAGDKPTSPVAPALPTFGVKAE